MQITGCERFLPLDIPVIYHDIASLDIFGGKNSPLIKRPVHLHFRHAQRQPKSVLGRAWLIENRVSVTCYSGQTIPDFLETLVHELAHIYAWRRYRDSGHGARWHYINHAAWHEYTKKFLIPQEILF